MSIILRVDELLGNMTGTVYGEQVMAPTIVHDDQFRPLFFSHVLGLQPNKIMGNQLFI
jgi:hypothetical protein